MKSLLLVDNDSVSPDLVSERMWQRSVFVISSPTVEDALNTLRMVTPDSIVLNTNLAGASRFVSDPRVAAADPLVLLVDDFPVHRGLYAQSNVIVLERREAELEDLVAAVTGVPIPLSDDAATALIRSVAAYA